MLRRILPCFTVLALAFTLTPTVRAETTDQYLDKVLDAALSGATAEQERWVADEIQTRDARKIEGDANRAAFEATKKAGEQTAALNEAARKEEEERREAERKAREEEERRRKMAEDYERELRRDEAARRRAIESAQAQAEANRTIMEAINRNAQGIADAYKTGQDAVAAANREKARIEADRAVRAAEAQFQRQQTEARAQADREARARADAAAAAARKRAEDARLAAEKATAAANSRQQQVAANTPTTNSAPRQAPAASSSGEPRMAANSGSSSAPAKTFRRVESLTYCTYKTERRPADTDVAWLCDGPTQKLQLWNTLRDGLGYTGCGNADTGSRRQTMGKGDIFYCEKAIAPYDRDIASIYNVPATIRGHRHAYDCKQTSDTCTRETAVKFHASGGL